MTSTILIKAICLGIVGAPQLIAGIAGVSIPPAYMALLGVLGLIAASVLSETEKGTGRKRVRSLDDFTPAEKVRIRRALRETAPARETAP